MRLSHNTLGIHCPNCGSRIIPEPALANAVTRRTRSHVRVFLLTSSFSFFQVCRHPVRLRELNSRRRVTPDSSANPTSWTWKMPRSFCRVVGASPRASASARKTPTASLTVGIFADFSSSPLRAEFSYLRASSSACSQDFVFAETRKRPVRPGRVPSSHLGQLQWR